MSLAINHNLMAANTASNLNSHYDKLSVSTQRLSSGLRINSAADDAAGLAIRELQRTDISTLNQGARNANDAVSMIQTADGALGVIDEKLTRMKELAEQAATGTYDSTQRLMIESEYQAMASEITRIANSTDFNGIQLLDGNLQSNVHNGSGLTSTGKLKIHFGSGNDSSEDYYYIKINGAQAWNLGDGLGSGATARQQALRSARAAYDASFAIHNDEVIAQSDYDAVIASIEGHISDEKLAEFPNVDDWNALPWYEQQRKEFEYANHALPHVLSGICVYGVLNNTPPGSAQKVGESAVNAFGSFRGNTIITQEYAQNTLDAISEAIIDKDKIRAHLGSMQNRLENTITNLNIQAENLQTSESRISDVDVSAEMTNFTREQIISQSAVAMLAQANSLPQMAMKLIGG